MHWGVAPGYVSWCPLGWNNRPVFGLNINVNIGHGYYNPWRAWTVVPVSPPVTLLQFSKTCVPSTSRPNDTITR